MECGLQVASQAPRDPKGSQGIPQVTKGLHASQLPIHPILLGRIRIGHLKRTLRWKSVVATLDLKF
jgi:hypothetical protein